MRQSAATMFSAHEIRFPSPALRPFVQCYLEIRMGSPGERHGCLLPAKLEQCIFFSTDTVATIQALPLSDGNILSADKCCYVRGSVKNSMLKLQITGTLSMFVIVFRPTGFFRFFNIPGNHFINTFTHADISLGNEWEGLGRRLRETGTMDSKTMLVERHMLKQLGNRQMDTEQIDTVISNLLLYPEPSVAEMARQSYLSERHFRRKFIERTGLQPQTFARICRSNQAIRMKQAQPVLSWRSIAMDTGYTDQSHFRKEMRVLMGVEKMAAQYADKQFMNIQGTSFKLLEYR